MARPEYFGNHIPPGSHPEFFSRHQAAWLPIGCFLVRAGDRLVLIDAGLGPDLQQLPHGMHLALGLGSDGTVFKDGESSFTMPPGNEPASSYISDLDQGGLQLSGTIMAVNHFRHVWGEWHARFILGFGLDAAGIRAEIADGQFTVVGPAEVHGQKAVELKINVPANHEAPPHVTAARLWVNATTYLPVRQYVRMSTGEQNVTDYTFLPPTAANLAKLRPDIPAGYTRAGRTQVTGPRPKMAE